MDSIEKAWKRFEVTGSIDAYMEYKRLQKKSKLNNMFEFGEEYEIDENEGDSNKDSQI